MRLDLYVLTDDKLSRGRGHVEVAQEAIRGGATAIQLRAKELTCRQAFEVGRELRLITLSAGVLFIVNDRVDLTLAIDADGVHLGPDDLPVSEARRILGTDKIVGASTGTVEEARQAEAEGADYLGVGAIYATGSKADAGEAVGPGRISAIREVVNLPIVGIGGIGPDGVEAVIAAGADGVAVVSAVVAAEDIAAAARDLRVLVDQAKRNRG